jgi:zinc transporter ZupT
MVAPLVAATRPDPIDPSSCLSARQRSLAASAIIALTSLNAYANLAGTPWARADVDLVALPMFTLVVSSLSGLAAGVMLYSVLWHLARARRS